MPNEQEPASSHSTKPNEGSNSSKFAVHCTYVKVDSTTSDGLRDAAIQLLTSIHGRAPTAEEIARIETRLAQRTQKPA